MLRSREKTKRQIIPWLIYILAVFLVFGSLSGFSCGGDGNRSYFKECHGGKMLHGRQRARM